MEPKISFRVTDIKSLPATACIECVNLTKGMPYCVTKWEKYLGGTSSYEVLCICKNEIIAKQIAEALRRLH